MSGNNGMSSRLLFTTATTFSNCFSLAAPVETESETADVAGRFNVVDELERLKPLNVN